MLYNFSFAFLVFFIYSIIGYFVEVITISIEEKRINFSRGYLLGPYIPVFGFGAILMVSLLKKYQNDIFVLFGLSLIICCTLEYFTSLLMEKIFKLRWWDYSNMRFNINGRVCLEYGIGFGLSGVILVRYFNPFLVKLLKMLPKNILVIVAIVLFTIVIIDTIISTSAVLKLKIDFNKYFKKDATSIIRTQVINSIQKYAFIHRRFLRAFPNIKNNLKIKNIMNFVDIRKKK